MHLTQQYNYMDVFLQAIPTVLNGVYPQVSMQRIASLIYLKYLYACLYQFLGP